MQRSGMAARRDELDDERQAWHKRFIQYCDQYDRQWSSPAEHVQLVAGGLRAWAGMVPQKQTGPCGEHQPVNSWGLAPELLQLQIIITYMALSGNESMAVRIEKLGQELQAVAAALDECYPLLSKSDKAAETRLSRFARQQARSLAGLLLRLRKQLGSTNNWQRQAGELKGPQGGKPSLPPPRGKRAGRAMKIEKLKAEVIEHIKAAADHARAAMAAGRRPRLLPRPSKAELGRRLKLNRWDVSRCFSDPPAHELRVLWDMAGDLDSILKRA